jgi:hypothetical protein
MNALETMIKHAEALGNQAGAPMGYATDVLNDIGTPNKLESKNVHSQKQDTSKPDDTESLAANNSVLKDDLITEASNQEAKAKAQVQTDGLSPKL